MNSVLAHLPPCRLPPRGDAAIAIAPVFGRQGDDGAGQLILVRQQGRHVALRAAVLTDDPAGVTFGRDRTSPGSRPPPAGVARGLQVSRGDVRQHLILQG